MFLPIVAQSPEKGWHVLSLLPVGVILVDNKFRVQFINVAAEKMFASEPAKVIGRRLGAGLNCRYDATSPKGCMSGEECAKCTLKLTASQALKSRNLIKERKASIPLNDGNQELALFFDALPVSFKNERHILFVFSESQESRETDTPQVVKDEEAISFRSFIDLFYRSNTLMLSVKRNTGVITGFNRAVLQTTGRTPEDLEERGLIEIFDPEDLDQAIETIKIVSQGEVTTKELKVLTNEANPQHYAFEFFPTHSDDNSTEIILVGHDVSDKSELEETLASAYRELTDKTFQLSLLEDEKNTLAEELHGIRTDSKIKALESNLGKSKEEIQRLNEELAAKDAYIEELRQGGGQASGTSDKSEEMLVKDEQIRFLEQKLAEQKEKRRQSGDLEQRLMDAEKLRDSLSERLSKSQKAEAELKELLSDALDRNSEFEQEIEELEGLIGEKEEEVEKLKQQIEQLEKRDQEKGHKIKELLKNLEVVLE